ncbi:MAG: ABC transporter ATP-binding protein/permease [Firmicutes bacterium]|nr:ABC transporter ATP-binding protein/permease [Bacillota bacterium]
MKPKTVSKSQTFRRFLGYVRPYWFYILLAVTGGIVKFTVPLFVPQVTRHLVDHVYLNSNLSVPAKLHELYLYVGGMILAFLFIWAPLVYIRHYYAGKAGNRSVFDLRCGLYERILQMSTSFFHRHQSGGIVSRLISDIALAQNLVGNALTNIWMDAIALIVILYFLFGIHAGLTWVALATFPLYLFFYRKLGAKLKATSHQIQQEIEFISGNVQEKIAGSLVVHAFGQEKKEQRSFHRDSERLFSTTMYSVFLQSINMAVTGTLTNLAPLIVAIYGGYQVILGRITVGELVAVGMYLGPLYLPLQRFSELNVVFSSSVAALDRIFEIMDEEPEVADKPDAVTLERIEGRVEYVDVSFCYHKENPILHRVNFTVAPGEKVAIVGQSGSGKTTLVSLIPRFYDPDAGAILVDGYDVRDIKLKSLRRQIGIVLQDPVLFSGTIRENILYGNPKATFAEVIAAAKTANAYEFIKGLPQGFETEVGERGVLLSGGQKQRLTIARAFLKDPRILILDEATSNLDAESERLIQDALERLMVNRTTFIIAHRLTTVMNADRILVLHNGAVVQSGTHQELISTKGIYQTLYSRQFEAGS